MNEVILTGRLTADPEVRYTQSDNPMAVARYTLAVDRRYKRDNEPTADFIRCVAFSKNAEFAEKYLKKGSKILVNGHIQTGSYKDAEDKTVYTTDVVIDSHEFCESKRSEEAPAKTDEDGFMNIPEGINEDLPFAQPQR